ncbi:MAG TPA: hypothetical protein VF206_06435 [Rubrobacter sp.]
MEERGSFGQQAGQGQERARGHGQSQERSTLLRTTSAPAAMPNLSAAGPGSARVSTNP